MAAIYNMLRALPLVDRTSPLMTLVSGMLATIFLYSIYHVYSKRAALKLYKGFPLVTLDEQDLDLETAWLLHGSEIAKKGFETHNDRPFQVWTRVGPMIMLPNRFAAEVKGEAKMSFNRSFCIDFFPSYPGFQAFKHGLLHEQFITDIVVRITQDWPSVTNRVVEEITSTIHNVFGEDTEWNECGLKESMSAIVVNSMSRVFVGSDVSRNHRWLEIALTHPGSARVAAMALKDIPHIFRRVAHSFIPASKMVQRDYSDTANLIQPELQRRKAEARKATQAGQEPPRYHDALEYMDRLGQEQRINVDHAAWLLALSIASVHTPADALAHAMVDLCDHPELVQQLRDEIIETVGKDGWRKSVYYKMKIMDSFLKESQRLHPAETVSMHRYVTDPITLSDGSVLPASCRFMVQDRLMDPTVYAEPGEFKIKRFLDKREMPDASNIWQHATVSTVHMAFGYGHYACPGRFIASNVLKMSLAHLLMKYDWKLAAEDGPRTIDVEAVQFVHPAMKLQFRRRQEEIDVDVTS